MVGRLIKTWRLLDAPCRDMAALLSKAADTELTFWERFAVNLHVLYCRACRRYKKQLGLLREALRRVSDSIAVSEAPPLSGLSDEARRRIAQSLRNR